MYNELLQEELINEAKEEEYHRRYKREHYDDYIESVEDKLQSIVDKYNGKYDYLVQETIDELDLDELDNAEDHLLDKIWKLEEEGEEE